MECKEQRVDDLRFKEKTLHHPRCRDVGRRLRKNILFRDAGFGRHFSTKLHSYFISLESMGLSLPPTQGQKRKTRAGVPFPPKQERYTKRKPTRTNKHAHVGPINLITVSTPILRRCARTKRTACVLFLLPLRCTSACSCNRPTSSHVRQAAPTLNVAKETLDDNPKCPLATCARAL